ncbi:MAG TPA: GNAT family N-acetyltransferase [Streptosporangiaceae bacterium]|nr:GNAT family N-acetyltransferase [Streptosporangiaceae bacterium]
MTAHVIRASETDVGVLSRVIAEAFIDLPPSAWLVSDPEARRALFPGYFRILVEQTLAGGVVHTTPDRDAVALWRYVDGSDGGADGDYAARLTAATSPWTERFVRFDGALESGHPSGAPHHYLAILAVRPDRQGAGLGTAMLDAYHQVIDETGAAAYLEASHPRTRTLYLRHGYADHGSPIQLPDGPVMYPMWRPASSGL